MLHLAHQSGIRQGDEVHVPGLAHPVPELTLAHAQVLLPVPVKGLRPGPASLVDLQDAMRFPARAIGDQNLARLVGCRTRPEYEHAHRMTDTRQANGRGEVPLGVASHGELRADKWRERLDPRADRRFRSAHDNDPIGFQITDIAALLGVDMVHNRGIGEVAIKRKVTGDALGDSPVN